MNIDLTKIDSLLWDIDGILTDENASPVKAIKATAQAFGQEINETDVKKLKRIVGFNNDWDCAFVLSQVIKPEVFASNPEKYRQSEDYLAVKDRYQGIYLGRELYERFYGVKSREAPEEGLITLETCLLDLPTLKNIQRKFPKMGVVTGRPYLEASFALEHWGVRSVFETVVGLEDTVKHKPDPEPVLRAIEKLHLQSPLYIGDTKNDFLAAQSAGIPAIIVHPEPIPGVEAQCESIGELVEILKHPRNFSFSRHTSETQIECEVNLDGEGRAEIETPIGFLNHMLHAFAKHSGVDLKICVNGDTHIDDHHTVEDIGIVLGKSFKEAIADKRGINRYGFFMLPMDECLTTAVFDFSGRYSFNMLADFDREQVGELSTEMVWHFWDSFAQNASANLIIKSEFGTNDHHKIEGIFKACARAVGIACSKDPNKLNQIASTKGVI